jgi:hypothetical protein
LLSTFISFSVQIAANPFSSPCVWRPEPGSDLLGTASAL